MIEPNATVASVAASASNVTILGAVSGDCNGRTVYNASTATLYLKFGTTATTSLYTLQVPPAGYFEFPFPVYSGEVDGIWSAANGNALTTQW